MDQEKRPYREGVKEFLKFLFIATAIALPVRYFVAQPFIVRGASMQPNYHEREYLIVDEISYFFGEPKRGEVVVFRYPLDPRQFFIKRIIGLPGERVEIRDGKVFVAPVGASDPQEIAEPYLSGVAETSGAVTMTLGPDDYFVLGDNRSQSADSRVWGVLPRNLITGRAIFRAWPVSRLGILAEPPTAYPSI